MSKQRSVRNVPIVTVAPISKKLGAGSTAKSGTGLIGKSSNAKTGGSFGAGGKTGNSFVGTAKSSSKLGSSVKSTSAFVTSGKTNSSLLGSSGKSTSAFGTSGKASSSLLGSSGKSSGLLGSSGKSSSPPIIIAKPTNAFNTSPSKSNPSTSFSTPKKPSTSFGIIWIPTKRRNKKKEYVHVSHRYDDPSKERSPSMYPQTFMSGDSPSHLPLKKKDEEATLLVTERPLGPIATAASAGAVVAAVEPPRSSAEVENSDDKAEKQGFIRYDKEESKEAAGDTNYRDDKDYLEHDSDNVMNKSSDSKCDKEKGDNVDSVYLRAPPPHKVRSNTSQNEEEDCGIKCLYYTLQCCDCVLM